MFRSFSLKRHLPTPDAALPGRSNPLAGVPTRHAVLDAPLAGPWPQGTEVLYVGMGCFWGAERIFWRLDGVVSTAVGYMGGHTPNPTYEEVCSGRTGHTEAVMVAYDRSLIGTDQVLATFWENHDPTQGFRQGNDVGTQYRSAIYWTSPEQQESAERTQTAFQKVLRGNGFGDITTEVRTAADTGEFYYAEDYHQQYLQKVPGGYCTHGPNGMTCPVGVGRLDAP